MLIVVVHFGRWELAIHMFWSVDFTLRWFWCESWVLLEDWSGTLRYGIWWCTAFGSIVSFHGNVSIHVFVANDDGGNNVIGKLRMTQNWLRSVICSSQGRLL